MLGDTVRIAADQATGTGPNDVKKGAVYEWMGEDGPVDLTATDYTDLGLWRPVAASTAVPQGFNVTNSGLDGHRRRDRPQRRLERRRGARSGARR